MNTTLTINDFTTTFKVSDRIKSYEMNIKNTDNISKMSNIQFNNIHIDPNTNICMKLNEMTFTINNESNIEQPSKEYTLDEQKAIYDNAKMDSNMFVRVNDLSSLKIGDKFNAYKIIKKGTIISLNKPVHVVKPINNIFETFKIINIDVVNTDIKIKKLGTYVKKYNITFVINNANTEELKTSVFIMYENPEDTGPTIAYLLHRNNNIIHKKKLADSFVSEFYIELI